MIAPGNSKHLVFPLTILLSLILVIASAKSTSAFLGGSTEEDRLEYIEAEADDKAEAVNNYYRMGKACYHRGDFSSAVANFKKLLAIAPDYEPAKLYLKCAIFKDKLEIQQQKINLIKLKMADIVADYDRRIERVGGLAFTYLLEQALLRCQAGDFAGAEYYYNLCYKLDPQNKETISWFVNATYELKALSESLDEYYRKIEEDIAEVEGLD